MPLDHKFFNLAVKIHIYLCLNSYLSPMLGLILPNIKHPAIYEVLDGSF